MDIINPTKPSSLMNLIKSLLALQISIVLFVAGAWIVNLYKLTQCDFAPSWKGEIIHAIGLLPPAAVVTVWFNDK